METGSKHWVYNPKDGNPCTHPVTRQYNNAFLDLAQIIDTRPALDDSKQTEYYIHYVNRTTNKSQVNTYRSYCLVDKRMDEWVGVDRFLSTEDVPDLEEPSEPVHDGPMTRNQRRKIHDHNGIPVSPSKYAYISFICEEL